jgi:tetraacyldisaccharide 4'-kinase
MDDGLQNPSLVQDAGVLVIDGAAGFGNRHLLPAGPLREPVAAAAARCRVAVLIGADETGALALLPAGLAVLRAAMVPGAAMAAMAGARVVAFAGIGRPAKFFASLRQAGVDVAVEAGFADHHFYGTRELAGLRRQASALGAALVTTTKDYARLDRSARAGIAPLGVELAWEDEAEVTALLSELVSTSTCKRQVKARLGEMSHPPQTPRHL